MELNKLIEDLKALKHAGFIDCNIQNILDKLNKVTESIVVDQFVADWFERIEKILSINFGNGLTMNLLKVKEKMNNSICG